MTKDSREAEPTAEIVGDPFPHVTAYDVHYVESTFAGETEKLRRDQTWADAANEEHKRAEGRSHWMRPGHGVKFDQDKAPWHLVPFDALLGVVKVLQFGAGKYSERNWETGMDWSRVFSALMRHLTAWFNGEKADAETGFSHLWHAGCCILFLIAFEMRGVGNDDRPRLPSKNTPE